MTAAKWIAAALNVGGIGVIFSLIARYPNDVYHYGEISWLPVLGALGGCIFFILHIYYIIWGSRDAEMVNLTHDLEKARMEKELFEIKSSME